MLGAVGLDELVLDDPVHLALQLQRLVLDRRDAVLPHVERPLLERREALCVGVAQRPVQVLALDVERADLAAVGQPHPPAAGDVVADLPDGADRVLQRHVPEHDALVLEHAQHHRGGAHLEEGGVLAHVGVAHDDVQPAVALGVGVGLVAGVDDRTAAGGRRRHALPDVLGPLGQAVHRAPGRLQHLACAGVDLAGHEERDEHVGVVGQVVAPAGQVVLVAAVAVAGRVRVVLEQVDDAADALLPEALLGGAEELLEDALAGLVVHDEVVDGVALGRRVLGMRTDVEVQTGAVGQEHVGAPAPADHPAEQVAGDLVGAEAALAPQRARHPVLVLEPEDAPLHRPSPYPPPLPDQWPAPRHYPGRREFLRPADPDGATDDRRRRLHGQGRGRPSGRRGHRVGATRWCGRALPVRSRARLRARVRAGRGPGAPGRHRAARRGDRRR